MLVLQPDFMYAFIVIVKRYSVYQYWKIIHECVYLSYKTGDEHYPRNSAIKTLPLQSQML